MLTRTDACFYQMEDMSVDVAHMSCPDSDSMLRYGDVCTCKVSHVHVLSHTHTHTHKDTHKDTHTRTLSHAHAL